MALRRVDRTLGLISIFVLNSAIVATCLPNNIRIQVNNENLQSPPYLLQAIKEAEAANQSLSAAAAQPSYQDSRASQLSKLEETDIGIDSVANGNFSVIKEETIEEILDLEPDSVLKLPSNGDQLMGALSPMDLPSQSSDESMSVSESSNLEDFKHKDDRESSSLVMPATNKQHDNGKLKPQLPVTNSHLKKPATPSSELDNEGSQAATKLAFPTSDLPSHSTGGAKTFVAPTVVSDDQEPAQSSGANLKKVQPSIPDTLEPSQVMNGVTNASLVPATITREYGYQKRTRVTLGGGYNRDKSSALVNPTSDPYGGDKPEKPVAPLENPQQNRDLVQESKVVEVPERIVLPASIFKQQPKDQQVIMVNNKQVPAGEMLRKNSTNLVRKQDNRCPRDGVMTFEHPTACDKYYYCEDGYLSEHTCPNGLLYGTKDMVRDYCVHRWTVVCGEKSIPNPISSPGCRWQFGIFNVQGSPRCSPDFYECAEGIFSVKKCSIEGQVYDDRSKSCQFAESVGCEAEAISEFKCPPDDQANTYWPFPRYFLNERSLIHCINDKPEIVRCTDNERVDPEHLHCVPMAKRNPDGGDDSDSLVSRKSREKNKKTSAATADQPASGR